MLQNINILIINCNFIQSTKSQTKLLNPIPGVIARNIFIGSNKREINPMIIIL